MQKEMKASKNKVPKITEEEYLQYVTTLKESEENQPKQTACAGGNNTAQPEK